MVKRKLTTQDLVEAPEVRAEDLLEMERETFPEPLPLYRPPEEGAPFPVDALGPLEQVVRETVRIVQAPEALVAASFLASASYAAQGVADLEVDGRRYPLSLFLLTVAESGERKTAVDLVATAPIRQWQSRLQGALKSERVSFHATMEVWETERKAILAAKGLTPAERARRLAALGPQPTPPWSGVVLATEPTMEGLARLLALGWPSIALFANEAGVFLGGYAMSTEHRLKAISTLSTLWDGQPIDRVRVGDGAVLLNNRRLAAHLMAQAEVARTFINDPLAREQGVLARFLMTAPPSTVGRRRYVAEDPKATPAYRHYAAQMGLILDMVQKAVMRVEDKEAGLQLGTITLTKPAKSLWIEYHDDVETRLAAEDLAPVRAFAAKLPEHALRIAGVLTLLQDPGAAKVQEETVERSMVLAEYFLGEALRLANAYRIPKDLLLAEAVFTWIRRHLHEKGRTAFHLAEVYRLGPSAVRSAAKARQVLRTLEAHHLILPAPGEKVDGQRRREAWILNPRL